MKREGFDSIDLFVLLEQSNVVDYYKDLEREVDGDYRYQSLELLKNDFRKVSRSVNGECDPFADFCNKLKVGVCVCQMHQAAGGTRSKRKQKYV